MIEKRIIVPDSVKKPNNKPKSEINLTDSADLRQIPIKINTGCARKKIDITKKALNDMALGFLIY